MASTLAPTPTIAGSRPSGVWRFDDFVLDTRRYELRCDGDPVRVEPQVFDVLTQLVANHQRFVSKEELFDTVWGGRFVGEAALTSRIKTARRALGDDGGSQRYIRTVRGRGYQFVGTLASETCSETTLFKSKPAKGPAPRQHIGFCQAADGTRLAYGIAGDGPPLVRAANWMTHLGYDIESPVWRHWVRDLSLDHRLVRYDERGCGLSDWQATDFCFEDWVTDLESVVDAVQLDRFPLLGVSQGAAVAVAYAARHPERVSRLVLCGGYARGMAARAVSENEKRAAALDLELARVGWEHADPPTPRDDTLYAFLSGQAVRRRCVRLSRSTRRKQFGRATLIRVARPKDRRVICPGWRSTNHPRVHRHSRRRAAWQPARCRPPQSTRQRAGESAPCRQTGRWNGR
ncbi:alpha/beta fold hydrolase [Mycobacterium ahvazicum]|uniref:alpha/beta fold hydrolase n=1 Tax=Mycobacterium ahvazicum TaxID=1964395 RepID=UPI001FAFDC13|nr:alpha/beta fold hydrolase [Mycobacterium ahvazicum]